MDAVTELFETIRAKKLSQGKFRGFLHVLIGRRVTGPAGEVVTSGMTFRDLAATLKKLRWEPEDVRELGIDPNSLPPRDRQRYWFMAICQARVDGETASSEADQLTKLLHAEGYKVSPAPGHEKTA